MAHDDPTARPLLPAAASDHASVPGLRIGPAPLPWDARSPAVLLLRALAEGPAPDAAREPDAPGAVPTRLGVSESFALGRCARADAARLMERSREAISRAAEACVCAQEACARAAETLARAERPRRKPGDVR